MVTTPGIRSASWEKLRPFNGMALIVVSDTTWPTTAFWVWRMGVTPVTSTVSLDPDLELDVDPRVLAGLEPDRLLSKVWNPCNCARTL